MTTVAYEHQQQQPVRSTIPARLDRLRWSPFHTRLVLGLGTAWILDGLEITIASSVSGKLTSASALNLSTTQASAIGTIYLVGEVVGALVFGRLSDKLGRRKLFMWTLAIYLVGTGFSALAFKGGGGLVYFYATRFIAGTGIGGEYSAVNSAIDEMMPARYRGRTDIWINGSYWLGSIIGTFAALLLLNSLPADTGWRLGFLVGPVLAIVILVIRRNLPESPRCWRTASSAGRSPPNVWTPSRSSPGSLPSPSTTPSCTPSCAGSPGSRRRCAGWRRWSPGRRRRRRCWPPSPPRPGGCWAPTSRAWAGTTRTARRQSSAHGPALALRPSLSAPGSPSGRGTCRRLCFRRASRRGSIATLTLPARSPT
jgi:hypothetical protein